MKTIEGAIDSIRAAAKTITALGVVLTILGGLSILMPWVAGLAVQAMVGLLAIAAGVAWITFAFHAHSWDSGMWETLVGLFAVITGVLMLGHPVLNLEVLTLILAAYFISTGILRIIFAAKVKGLSRNWRWIFFNGVVSILLGVMISYQWPFSGLWAIGTLLGIDMVFGGFSLIQIGSSAGRVLR